MSQQPQLTLKSQVYALLTQNPGLLPKAICEKLHISYKDHGGSVRHIRCSWKRDTEKQHGSVSSIHAWRGWVYLPGGVGPDKAVAPWKVTTARNRWLLLKNNLGRLQWFYPSKARPELGSRVNIYARAPVEPGRIIQLLAQAFTWTEIITDLKVFRQVVAGIRFKGAHYVVPLGFRLPQPIVVDLFGPSNGVVVKLSDRSHRDALELQVHYPDWAERNEKLFRDLEEFFKDFTGGPGKPRDPKSPYWV
jgi:hypothetical protein